VESGTVYGSAAARLRGLEDVEQSGERGTLRVEWEDVQRRNVDEPDPPAGETPQGLVVDVIAEVAPGVVALGKQRGNENGCK
jgi:hypothetical protein